VSVLKKAPRSFEIGFQDDRDDSTEPAHLLAREIVLRMRFEPGIMDRFYLRVFLEPACDFQRVRAMPFHPQRQCFQSAERQETVEGSRDCADRILQERDLRSEEHTSELQSLAYLVCRLLLEKKKGINDCITTHIR